MKSIPELDEVIDQIDAFLLGDDVSTFEGDVDVDGLTLTELEFGLEKSTIGFIKFNPSVLKIIELWRSLPSSDPARCFMPGYALFFKSDGKEIMRAALCWRCDLMKFKVSGEADYSWAAFDANSVSAKDLLSVLRNDCKRSILPQD